MGPPSPPLPLTAANLAVLQTRQAPQTSTGAEAKAAPDQARPAAPSGASGRGRLIDILA
jgi:hypothetical protein